MRFPARREYEHVPDPVVIGQGEQNDAKEQVKNDSAAVDSQSAIYQKASNKNHKACL